MKKDKLALGKESREFSFLPKPLVDTYSFHLLLYDKVGHTRQRVVLVWSHT